MSANDNTNTEESIERSLSTSAARRPSVSAERTIEEFVRKNYLDIYRYLYHRVSNASDAQDLTQDTFLRYLEHVDTTELKTKGRAYLFTIARNVSNDFYRTRRLDTQPITPELEETLSDDNTCAEQTATDFDTLVAKLDEKQREVLSLKYAQGFGINEIAEITSSSRFAVRRRIQRALAQLQDLWKESEHAK